MKQAVKRHASRKKLISRNLILNYIIEFWRHLASLLLYSVHYHIHIPTFRKVAELSTHELFGYICRPFFTPYVSQWRFMTLWGSQFVLMKSHLKFSQIFSHYLNGQYQKSPSVFSSAAFLSDCYFLLLVLLLFYSRRAIIIILLPCTLTIL